MMSQKIDTIIRNAQCVRSDKIFQADIAIADGLIQSIEDQITIDDPSVRQIDAKGMTLIPGVIDSQVHFRDPGLTHKEDLTSGSKAAIAGGVTTFLEMPNTKPSTTTVKALEEKISLANEKSFADFGFFIGASLDNLNEIKLSQKIPGRCGVKIFLGSSTGDLLLYQEEALRKIFTQIPEGIIAVHSENEQILKDNISIRDEAKSVHAHTQWRSPKVCLSSTQRIVRIARECKRPLHILHISTAEEVEFLKDQKDLITFEITPQHLTLFAPDCYDRLGTFAQMNPPIREKYHQDKLWWAIQNKIADVIGSDHAPHTKEEKNQTYPNSPSGMPGVQTMLPLMLSHRDRGMISLEDIVHYLCEAPAKLYGLKDRGRIEVGKKADLVFIDLQKQDIISNSQMQSRCEWTPFDGTSYTGAISEVLLSGKTVFKNGQFTSKTPTGQPVHID